MAQLKRSNRFSSLSPNIVCLTLTDTPYDGQIGNCANQYITNANQYQCTDLRDLQISTSCHPQSTDKKVSRLLGSSSQLLVVDWKKYPCKFH